MSRSLNLPLIALFLVLLSIGSGPSCTPAEKESEKPNIIFIMADDLGIGDLGCYGQQIIRTPHIDELASRGMLFTRHYAGNTVCAPSRCALMTGYHMGHAGVRGNRQANPSGQWPISDTTLTVAELLQSAGYNTAMIGKWGLGVENTSGDPLNQGFDFYYGYLDQVLAHNYYPEYLLRNGKKEYLDNEVHYLDSSLWHRGLGSYSTVKNEYSHDLFTREALSYIREQRDSLFFLYLPYTIPHNNGEAPEGEQQEVPGFGVYEDRDWPRDRKGYAAMISRMDRDVGQIMQLLDEMGLAGRTVLFFTSDNGPMPDREFTTYFDSNGPFRGGKRDLYEGGIRVPMIVSWKGKIRPGTRNDHLSAFWDFLPTACDLAGIAVPAGVDGISFLPALTGKEQPRHESLYWEFTERGGKQAIRKGNWKLVRNQIVSDPPGTIELYDLEEDPGETRDVSDGHPEVVRDLLDEMEAGRTKSEVFPLVSQ
ncbi:MAG: arylsulfatase [Bacteroidales bacterium]